jgi:hypothetical protein
MPEEKLNYLSLSVENITKSLSYEEAIKNMQPKNVGKKYYEGVLGSYE